jgi:hypothetical protein
VCREDSFTGPLDNDDSNSGQQMDEGLIHSTVTMRTSSNMGWLCMECLCSHPVLPTGPGAPHG